MLAPLENRNVLERELSPEDAVERLEAENRALKLALRVSRQNHKRQATLHARQSIEKCNRIAELEDHCRQLMAARDTNERLLASAQRVWYLDKTICEAHRICERLARERDNLALRLCQRAGAVRDGTDGNKNLIDNSSR